MSTYTKERILAAVRLLAILFAFVNSSLIAKGCNPIPFDETLVTECLGHGIDAVLAIWAWWKDNNVRKSTIDKKKRAEACTK